MSQEIVGRRLKWFREQRQRSQSSVCAEVGINDRQTLSDIEAGKRRVNAEELVRLSRALSVDLDDLLDPFRLVGEGGFNFRAKNVAADVVGAFEQKASRWIATYRELGRRKGIEPPRIGEKLELTKASSFEDVQASADALGREWKLGAIPARKLEQAIERHMNTLILHVDAPDGLSGAASTLPGLRTIIVNRNEPQSRRMFDLAHELFHILTWDAMEPARVEEWEPLPTKGNRVEQLAENFASALLMPSDAICVRWQKRADADLVEWARTTAHQLWVSPRALGWRLHNLGLVSKAAAVGLAGVSGLAGAPPPRPFSFRFVELVRDAVESGHLSVRRAASLLGLSLGRFSELCRSYDLPLSYEP